MCYMHEEIHLKEKLKEKQFEEKLCSDYTHCCCITISKYIYGNKTDTGSKGLLYTEVGDPRCGGSRHLSRKRDKSKMRDSMDRRVTPPSWGLPPPCKQALSLY